MSDPILLAELDNDPVAIGYDAAGWTGTPPTPSQYQAVADLINDSATRSRDRTAVPGREVFLAIQPVDFLVVFDGAGDAAHQDYFRFLIGDVVPLDDNDIRSSLATIFATMTTTLANLVALRTESISRATELGVLGRVDVGDLRRLKGDVS